MHGMISRPPEAATKNIATSRVVLLLLVVMTGIAPISLYILVPALPALAATFGRDILIRKQRRLCPVPGPAVGVELRVGDIRQSRVRLLPVHRGRRLVDHRPHQRVPEPRPRIERGKTRVSRRPRRAR